MTESKYLKREFGEPLPTFKDVMEKHQVNKLKEDWWSDMSSGEQADYIKRHPGSSKAQKAQAKQRAADDEADDMKSQDAQDSRDAEDRKDAGIKPIKKDKDTKRMGDSLQRRIGGSKDPDRLEVQGTQKASNGETIIQYKDKSDGSMVGVDAQGNIYEDGEKKNYGIDVSTQSDVFGADQNQQLLYKQKKDRKEAKQYIRGNKMKITEDIIRKVIRQEIKSVMKEDEEAFKQPIPATVERFMKKFISSLQGKNLNRKRKLAILGRLVVALKLDPSEVSKYARLVKREL